MFLRMRKSENRSDNSSLFVQFQIILCDYSSTLNGTVIWSSANHAYKQDHFGVHIVQFVNLDMLQCTNKQ